MSITNTLVAKSDNISLAALHLNQKAFEIRQTIAGVWDLKSSTSEAPESASVSSLDMKNDSHESVVGEDERIKVSAKDFMPGGKYRSIVKLFLHYEFQKKDKWAMGTGWLIKPDLLVTAGHCVYDWSHSYGRVTEVKAYIGYQGDSSIKNPSVQFRSGKRIVTTEGWLKTKGSKPFDVGFIQVNRPFTGIIPFKYEETPVKGQFDLGIVGYPGDLVDKSTGEKGAFMYEMFLPTTFDLATQSDTMLEYQIDTFGGNSGSPVLRQRDLVSIGAHVYGGTYNSASVIGKYGNPYDDYVAAFGLQLPNAGLHLIPVAGPTITSVTTLGQVNKVPNSPKNYLSHSGSYLNDSYDSPVNASTSNRRDLRQSPSTVLVTHTHREDEEGFFDFLKDAVRVGAPLLGGVLKTGLPLVLGPLGGPIGALAGVGLNAASKLAESTDAESGFDLTNLQEGTIERAILAEAAFAAVQEINLHPETEESIFSDMKDFIVKAAPTVRKVAPRILGAMMEPALRIAVDSLHKYNEASTRGAEGLEAEGPEPFRNTLTYSSRIDRPSDQSTEAFLSGLRNALSQGQEAFDDESQEGFIDIIQAGLRFGAQGLSFAAKTGLPLLAQALSPESADAESAEATSGSTTSLSSTDLAKRAIAGEAALQALMKLPPNQLQEEGIFDTITSVVKKIAPVVIKVAPDVFSNLLPTLGGLLRSAQNQAPVPNERKATNSQLPLNRKKSQPDLGRKSNRANFLSKVQQSRAANGK